MGIKSELHEAILKRGGKVPPYGGIAAAMDELNKLPGGGGDCDWNTMKNRPFGTEYGTIEVLGETTRKLDVPDDPMYQLAASVGLEIGKVYTVTYNGEQYKLTAKASEALNGFPAIGNVDGLTGEPFMIVDAGTEGGLVLIDERIHTAVISIHTEGEIVKQIDPKYIPGGNIRQGLLVKVVENDDGSLSADKTVEEIYAVNSAGGIVEAEYNGGRYVLDDCGDYEGLYAYFNRIDCGSQLSGLSTLYFTSDGVVLEYWPLQGFQMEAPNGKYYVINIDQNGAFKATAISKWF